MEISIEIPMGKSHGNSFGNSNGNPNGIPKGIPLEKGRPAESVVVGYFEMLAEYRISMSEALTPTLKTKRVPKSYVLWPTGEVD